MKKLATLVLVLALALLTFVACKGGEKPIDKAAEYLYSMYKDKDGSFTSSDFELAGVVKVDGVSYTVEWTSSSDKVKVTPNGNMVTIDVDEESAEEVAYTLTATVKDAEGNTAIRTIKFKVPKFKINTWEEYAAAAKGDNLVVQGVVTGIISKSQGASYNCIYMQDDVGGYYVYGMAADPVEAGIKVGMTVEARGEMDIYSGTLEVKNAAVTIIDSTIKTVTPADYTSIFTNAEDLKATELVKYQGLLVTIKGAELQAQSDDDAKNGYYRFKIGELSSYVRISGSTCPLDSTGKETFKTAFTEHIGYKADVTGVICVYDGAFYLTPVSTDSFSNFVLPERTDDQKVELELAGVSLPDRITEDTVITLPLTGATYETVLFSWASDNACAVIDNDGKLTITLPEEDATVTITLTVKIGETVKTTKTFTMAVNSASTDVYVPEKVATPAAGSTYKFFLYQAKLNQNLYFAGYMSGNYLATTDKGDKAVDVTIESVDGGVRFSFMDGETKKYIDVYEYETGKAGLRLTDEPAAVFTFDATLGVYTTVVAEKTYYIGTYNTYNTFSLSETFRISGDNASTVGVSQFPAFMCTLAPATYVPEKVATPAAGSTYKFFLYQAKLNQNLYFAGYMSGKYLATTDKADKAVDVTIETVDGGVRFSFMDGETKKYIDVYEYETGKAGLRLTDEPAAVFTFDATLGVYTTVVAEKTYYIGTYNTYNTMSLSETFRISGDNASTVGVSQFPAYFATIAAKKVAPVVPTEVKADTGYKFYLHQTKLDKDLYFAGYMSGNYLATTDKISKAVDVFVETVDGGVRFYFMDGEAKKYIDVYEYETGKAGLRLTDEPTAVFTFDATLKVYTTVVAEKTYYIGTYNTYNTMSLSETFRISGDNASTVGVSQFPAYFATIELVAEGGGEVTPPVEEPAYAPNASFTGYTSVNSVAVGDKIVITYVNTAGDFITELTGVSNKLGTNTDVTTGALAGTYLIEVVEGSVAGSVAFKLPDGTYLAWAASLGNKVTTSATIDAYSSWKVTSDATGVIVTNQGDTTRVLQYNTNSPRFCCYTGTQKSLTLWKKNAE